MIGNFEMTKTEIAYIETFCEFTLFNDTLCNNISLEKNIDPYIYD